MLGIERGRDGGGRGGEVTRKHVGVDVGDARCSGSVVGADEVGVDGAALLIISLADLRDRDGHCVRMHKPDNIP